MFVTVKEEDRACRMGSGLSVQTLLRDLKHVFCSGMLEIITTLSTKLCTSCTRYIYVGLYTCPDKVSIECFDSITPKALFCLTGKSNVVAKAAVSRWTGEYIYILPAYRRQTQQEVELSQR